MHSVVYRQWLIIIHYMDNRLYSRDATGVTCTRRLFSFVIQYQDFTILANLFAMTGSSRASWKASRKVTSCSSGVGLTGDLLVEPPPWPLLLWSLLLIIPEECAKPLTWNQSINILLWWTCTEYQRSFYSIIVHFSLKIHHQQMQQVFI